jgi:hypothetical protein
MNNWMLSKVRFTKQNEDGSFKRVTEQHLFAAISFTDTEARIYGELGAYIRGEFTVVSITRAEFHDIFHYEDADVWYKCAITFDGSEDGEKSKKTKQTFLVSANSVREANDRLKESLSTLLVDFKIESVSLTPIVDIYPFSEELDKEISRTMPEPKDYESTEELIDELPL